MENTDQLYLELLGLRNKLREQHKTKICTDDALKEIVLMLPRKASDFESITGIGKMMPSQS